MKLLFVHDHRFKKVNNKIYSNGGLDDNTLKRYTDLFGNVTVAARIEEVEKAANYSEITNPDVKIEHTYMDLNKINKLIETHDFIIFRLPSKQGLLAVKEARKLKKPYLIELVGCPWDAYWNHSLMGKALAPVMWFMTKNIVKKAQYVMYVSKQFLPGRYPTNGNFISCSDVSFGELNEDVLREKLLKLKNEKEEIIIGTVGAVDVIYKGQQYVIQALSKLKKEGYNIKYRLAGSGNISYLNEVAKNYGIEDNVEFCGPIPHEEILKFYDSLDIYIQPSLTEGLPRSVVEAMSRACPVIGTDVGGIPELVSGKYLFKKKSVNDICEKIRMIVKKEELISESKRSFEKAKDFEPERLDNMRKGFFEMFKREGKNIK